jgi:hypothetical protein
MTPTLLAFTFRYGLVSRLVPAVEAHLWMRDVLRERKIGSESTTLLPGAFSGHQGDIIASVIEFRRGAVYSMRRTIR